MRPQLCIFDFDNTILKFNISAQQIANTKAKINAYLRQYNIPQDNLKPLIPKIIFLAKSVTENKELQKKIISDCFSIIDEMEAYPDGGIKVHHDNLRLLNDLHTRGIKLGIISNNGREGVLNALRIAKLNPNMFTFLITRTDVSLPKPFPEPYLKIQHYLNTHDCYLFTDDIFDVLPLLSLEKSYNWSIRKYIVLQMDIKNHSYEWETGKRMDFEMLLRAKS